MTSLDRLPQILLLIGIVTALGYAYYLETRTVCDETLEYRSGRFDERFGISQTTFQNAIQQAETVWEESFDRNLFTHSETAEFEINLIFDERQQELLDQQALELELTTDETGLEELRRNYETTLVAYTKDLANYTADVAYWNDRGGAPAEVYAELQAEKRRLNRQANELHTLYEHLSTEIDNINQKIDLYNTEAGRIFDQGEYVGTSINVYQFEDFENLRILLTHELGHALGLDHVDDPRAVMHYLLQKQNLGDPTLTEADRTALSDICHLDQSPLDRALGPLRQLWRENFGTIKT